MQTIYALIFINSLFIKKKNKNLGFYFLNLLNIQQKINNKILIFGMLTKNIINLGKLPIKTLYLKKKYKIGFSRITWYWIFRILNKKKLFLINKNNVNFKVKNKFLEYELALKKYEIRYQIWQKFINNTVSFGKKYLTNIFLNKTIKNYTKSNLDLTAFYIKKYLKIKNKNIKLKKRIRKIRFNNIRSIRKKRRLSKITEIYFLKKKSKIYNKIDNNVTLKNKILSEKFIVKTLFKLTSYRKNLKFALWDLKLAKINYFNFLLKNSSRINILKNIEFKKIIDQKKNYLKGSQHKNKFLIYKYLFPKNTTELSSPNEFNQIQVLNTKTSVNYSINSQNRKDIVFSKSIINKNKLTWLIKFNKNSKNSKKTNNTFKKQLNFKNPVSLKIIINKNATQFLKKQKNNIICNKVIHQVKLSKLSNSNIVPKKKILSKNTYINFIKKFKLLWLKSKIFYKNYLNESRFEYTYIKFNSNLNRYDQLLSNLLISSITTDFAYSTALFKIKSVILKYKLNILNKYEKINIKKWRAISKFTNKHTHSLNILLFSKKQKKVIHKKLRKARKVYTGKNTFFFVKIKPKKNLKLKSRKSIKMLNKKVKVYNKKKMKKYGKKKFLKLLKLKKKNLKKYNKIFNLLLKKSNKKYRAVTKKSYKKLLIASYIDYKKSIGILKNNNHKFVNFLDMKTFTKKNKNNKLNLNKLFNIKYFKIKIKKKYKFKNNKRYVKKIKVSDKKYKFKMMPKLLFKKKLKSKFKKTKLKFRKIKNKFKKTKNKIDNKIKNKFKKPKSIFKNTKYKFGFKGKFKKRKYYNKYQKGLRFAKTFFKKKYKYARFAYKKKLFSKKKNLDWKKKLLSGIVYKKKWWKKWPRNRFKKKKWLKKLTYKFLIGNFRNSKVLNSLFYYNYNNINKNTTYSQASQRFKFIKKFINYNINKLNYIGLYNLILLKKYKLSVNRKTSNLFVNTIHKINLKKLNKKIKNIKFRLKRRWRKKKYLKFIKLTKSKYSKKKVLKLKLLALNLNRSLPYLLKNKKKKIELLKRKHFWKRFKKNHKKNFQKLKNNKLREYRLKKIRIPQLKIFLHRKKVNIFYKRAIKNKFKLNLLFILNKNKKIKYLNLKNKNKYLIQNRIFSKKYKIFNLKNTKLKPLLIKFSNIFNKNKIKKISKCIRYKVINTKLAIILKKCLFNNIKNTKKQIYFKKTLLVIFNKKILYKNKLKVLKIRAKGIIVSSTLATLLFLKKKLKVVKLVSTKNNFLYKNINNIFFIKKRLLLLKNKKLIRYTLSFYKKKYKIKFKKKKRSKRFFYKELKIWLHKKNKIKKSKNLYKKITKYSKFLNISNLFILYQGLGYISNLNLKINLKTRKLLHFFTKNLNKIKYKKYNKIATAMTKHRYSKINQKKNIKKLKIRYFYKKFNYSLKKLKIKNVNYALILEQKTNNIFFNKTIVWNKPIFKKKQIMALKKNNLKIINKKNSFNKVNNKNNFQKTSKNNNFWNSNKNNKFLKTNKKNKSLNAKKKNNFLNSNKNKHSFLKKNKIISINKIKIIQNLNLLTKFSIIKKQRLHYNYDNYKKSKYKNNFFLNFVKKNRITSFILNKYSLKKNYCILKNKKYNYIIKKNKNLFLIKNKKFEKSKKLYNLISKNLDILKYIPLLVIKKSNISKKILISILDGFFFQKYNINLLINNFNKFNYTLKKNIYNFKSKENLSYRYKLKKKYINFKNNKVKDKIFKKINKNFKIKKKAIRHSKIKISHRKYKQYIKKKFPVTLGYLKIKNKKINKFNNFIFKKIIKIKKTIVNYFSHIIPYNTNLLFLYKNYFLKIKKKVNIRKYWVFLKKFKKLSKIHTIFISTNNKTKTKKSIQVKHNFFKRKKVKTHYRFYFKIRKRRKLFKRRLNKTIKWKVRYAHVKKRRFFVPRKKRTWLPRFFKTRKILNKSKKKVFKKLNNLIKSVGFRYKNKNFLGARYSKFIIKMKRCKKIKAAIQAKSTKKHGFVTLRYWKRLKKSLKYRAKKKKKSFTFFNHLEKWKFWKKNPINWRVKSKYLRKRYKQFGKRFLPLYWYKVIRRKFPLKRKKKEWSIKIPKVYTFLYFKKNKKLTFFDSSPVYYKYLSCSSFFKRYNKTFKIYKKIITHEDELWRWDFNKLPHMSLFKKSRKKIKYIKQIKRNISEILLKKKVSKLFYPSMSSKFKNKKLGYNSLLGYNRFLNNFSKGLANFFNKKTKAIITYFNKLKKHIYSFSEVSSIFNYKNIEQCNLKNKVVSNNLYFNFIGNSFNKFKVIGHIYKFSKKKLLKHLAQYELNSYSIVNYKYNKLYNLDTVSLSKINKIKKYSLKIKQLTYSKYNNEVGFFFKKNLSLNKKNDILYIKLFQINKNIEYTGKCTMHQSLFFIKNKNSTVIYKNKVSPIFENKLSKYLKKNIQTIHSYSVLCGHYNNNNLLDSSF